MLKNKKILIPSIIIVSILVLVGIYFIPPVHERLAWRFENLRAEIFHAFNPPEEVVFNPTQQEELSALVESTLTAMAPKLTATLVPTATPTNYISPTPSQTSLPSATPTQLPKAVRLEGITHEYQKFNNCGPANLSMALSYWGWEGDQYVTAAYLKPNQQDRNVMLYEMVDFTETQTDLNAILRYGGDLDLIKRFVAAGFPVLVERGFVVEKKGWMGHYGVISGYDDGKQQFFIPDSYEGERGLDYDELDRYWHHFDDAYMVIYPPEREGEVFQLLGEHADEAYNIAYTAEKVSEAIYTTQGRENFFAWYGRGNMLVKMNDYLGAAEAYDQAFAVYEDLAYLDRPWRIVWYQTGPYFAYYYTGRYYDVISLADQTLSLSVEPAIEETWVWRARAKIALGDVDGAIEDLRKALEWHPGWWVAEVELQALGIEP